MSKRMCEKSAAPSEPPELRAGEIVTMMVHLTDADEYYYKTSLNRMLDVRGQELDPEIHIDAINAMTPNVRPVSWDELTEEQVIQALIKQGRREKYAPWADLTDEEIEEQLIARMAHPG